MKDIVKLMRTRRFFPLFSTQFLGAFNDNAFKNAFLIWFTYDMAEKSGMDAPMMVTMAAGLFILPFFLFSTLAGQVADKYQRSVLAQKIKKVEILLMLGCGLCFYLESIYGLLTILFLMGVQSTFFGPIKLSLLPEHLKEEELIAGNGLISAGTFLSILLGTIFGGLIIRTTYGVPLLSGCVVLCALVGWLSSRAIPDASIAEKDLHISWNIPREVWRFIGFARQEHTVWLSIVGISWFWLIGATFLTQFPVFTKEVIGGNEHIVTLFLTSFSVGIGIGSMWCNKLLRGEINGRLVPFGAFGISTSVFAFVLATYFFGQARPAYLAEIDQLTAYSLTLTDFFAVGLSSWGIMLSLLCLSICAGFYVVPLFAIIQHRSDERYLSRIIAANNIMNSLFMVISSLGAVALFACNFTVTEILLSTGIINIPVYFIIRGIVKRRLKHA